MRPEGWKAFGGGGGTTLHPAALAIIVVGVLLMWVLPRRHMLTPFLVLSILIPQQQQVVVLGLHFMVLRIIILCAWIRVIPSVWRTGRFLGTNWTATDVVFCLWAAWVAISYTLLWGDMGALVTKLGFLYNALGAYFLFRFLVRDRAEIDRTVQVFAAVCAILALLMAMEQFTGRNLLSVFGAPEMAEVRGGHVRAQASFAHPIIAGTFGALWLPVFIGAWWSRRYRGYALIGMSSAAVMALTSYSSTPVGASFAGVAALCMWPFRRQMRTIRWGALATLVGLHVVMKAPVWSLIHRLRMIGGSTSWHRFSLVDNCIKRVDEWWLIGTRENAEWGFDMWDTANWYVSSAISGGLLGLLLFVAVIALSFRSIGKARRASAGDRETSRFVWSLGAGLFGGAIAFLGIEFFDQSVVGWYALLAMITATVSSTRASPAGHLIDTVGENAAVPVS